VKVLLRRVSAGLAALVLPYGAELARTPTETLRDVKVLLRRVSAGLAALVLPYGAELARTPTETLRDLKVCEKGFSHQHETCPMSNKVGVARVFNPRYSPVGNRWHRYCWSL